MYVRIAAIICLSMLESVALVLGIDGALLLPMAAIIGGIAGYHIRERQKEYSEATWTRK